MGMTTEGVCDVICGAAGDIIVVRACEKRFYKFSFCATVEFRLTMLCRTRTLTRLCLCMPQHVTYLTCGLVFM